MIHYSCCNRGNVEEKTVPALLDKLMCAPPLHLCVDNGLFLALVQNVCPVFPAC